jgi:hypothetical protein
MIKLIQFLFSGCFHQWEVFNQALTWDKYTLRCKKCGAMKTFLAR